MASGTTVRIRKETRDTLRELEAHTGERTPDLLARAVDQFYRSLLIAETNCGYAELRAQEGSAEELDVLEGSLADGLDRPVQQWAGGSSCRRAPHHHRARADALARTGKPP
jgi:hypothetical protein